MNMTRTFVGIGFGPIQSGLFLLEAHQSGNFDRLVVAEISPELVSALRAAGGRYTVNVAHPDGVACHTVGPVEVLNPRVPADREALVAAVAEASELSTALPSVNAFGGADAADTARVLADGLRLKAERDGPPAVVYAAENHNHAAELLEQAVKAQGAPTDRCAFLNTVIGKMSGVAQGAAALRDQGLAPMTPGSERAFLVEAFNRILITRIPWPAFARGILVFEEKDDLLPFEEAKLFGHNAVHAMLGYLLLTRRAEHMSEAAAMPDLMDAARAALVDEAGAALCKRYAGLDPLFTPAGFAAYAEDLLRRMVNPHLRDAVERVTRDPRRKLGWNDRLIGSMRLCLAQGLVPRHLASGAQAAALAIGARGRAVVAILLQDIWGDEVARDPVARAIVRLIQEVDGGH